VGERAIQNLTSRSYKAKNGHRTLKKKKTEKIEKTEKIGS
jgi:hypothetical protein